MQTNQWILLAIVCIPLGLVVLNRLRIDLAALLMAISLGALQFLGMNMLGPVHTPADALKAISGFSQPVVITLISLFIVTHGLEKSSVTSWLARQILRLGGKNESRLIALFTGLTAMLSLFMNNLAAGALAADPAQLRDAVGWPGPVLAFIIQDMEQNSAKIDFVGAGLVPWVPANLSQEGKAVVLAPSPSQGEGRDEGKPA